MKYNFLLLLLCSFVYPKMDLNGQVSYNICAQALEICPNNSFSINNIGTNKTFCNSCEDDFTFCFTPSNTIWLKFNTNSTGGDATINFTNLIFESNPGQDNDLNATIIATSQPCTANAYTQIGNCALNETGDFSLSATGLTANTTYFIVVSGDKSGAGVIAAAECSMDLTLSGTGVDLPTPIISVFTDSLNVCKNQAVDIGVSIENCPDSTDFNWYINGEFKATTTEFFFQTSELDSGDIVSVSTTCYTKCITTLSGSTSAFTIESFYVDAGNDYTLQKGNNIQLQGSGDADSYFWSPSYSITNPTTLNPVAFPKETTTYTLSGFKNGCQLNDQVVITIESDLTIPERFSPNNDGVNDVFEIVGIEQFPNSFMRIYDRWGQEIFQKIAYSYENAWDGKGINKDVTPGVYFYVLELRDDSKQIFKGTITVVR